MKASGARVRAGRPVRTADFVQKQPLTLSEVGLVIISFQTRRKNVFLLPSRHRFQIGRPNVNQLVPKVSEGLIIGGNDQQSLFEWRAINPAVASVAPLTK